MAVTKKVLGVYQPGSTHWVGDGFPVRNLFPSNGLEREVSPFLLLDYAGPEHFAPTDKPRGVGEHPHRGFETVTIVYQGGLEHRDSGGNAGTMGPGDVQWMTAASGVVHEEKHEREFSRRGGTFEAIQLWVNLPRAMKMSPPRYQGILNETIPVAKLEGGSSARIIAGELNGIRGPAKTFTPINLFDVRLSAGQTAQLDLPAGHNTAIVLLHGDITVNADHDLKGQAQIAVLSPEGDRVEIAARADTTVLLLDGEPIHDPVASYGPFVMNTREELAKAVEDYRSGKMGHLQ